MSKHTPGPWILSTVPTSVGSCHKIGPFPNGDRSATFACVYADGHRKGIDDSNPAAIELAANARLIAAAPEMVDALIDLCNRILEEGATPLDWGEYEAALDAIARATGEAA